MAIYGISFYGSDLYGEPVLSVLNISPFTAESLAPGQVRLRWSAPGGSWSEFRLLRSGYGFAVNEGDGDVILSFTGLNYQSAFTDTGLAPNRFYYYTAFVFDLDTDQWVKAGEVQVLTLKDYGNLDQMIFNLPKFYFDMDDRRRSPSESEGQLRRFLRLLSFVPDHVQGETESLGWVRDADTVSGGLLPFFANDLGITYEPEIGMRQIRIWLRNAIYLYKIKGTRIGIEGIATAFTGWGADVQMADVADGVAPGVDAITIHFQANRVNLISNPSFEVDTSGWTVLNGTAATSATSFSGSGSLLMTTNVAGPIHVEARTTSGLNGIPVVEGRTYTASAYLQPGTTARNGQARIQWWDDTGALVSESVGDLIPEVLGEWTRVTLTAAAPAGAAFASVGVRAHETDNTEEHLVDAALFEESPEVQDYFDASFLGGDYLWEGGAHASPSHYYFNRAIKNARLDEVMEEYAPLGTTWNFVYAQP